jgi:hypothetical protein
VTLRSPHDEFQEKLEQESVLSKVKILVKIIEETAIEEDKRQEATHSSLVGVINLFDFLITFSFLGFAYVLQRDITQFFGTLIFIKVLYFIHIRANQQKWLVL